MEYIENLGVNVAKTDQPDKMNSREIREAEDKSMVPNKTLAECFSAIIPSSITKWFCRPQSSSLSDSANISHEPKRRRLSEDPNHYKTTPSCASTSTDSLYSPKLTLKRKHEDLLNANGITPEDAVNRVSFILKSSLLSEDNVKPKETFVDRNRSSASIPSPAKNRMIQYGKPSFDINGASGKTTYGGASNHLSVISQNSIVRRSTPGNRLHKSVDNIDCKMSGPSERIMQLLENYSSPLEEVRRISYFVRNENNNNLSISMSNNSSKQISNKTQELHVPSIATILSIKKKSGLMASTSTARQLLASQSSATKYSAHTHNRSDSGRKSYDNQTFKSKKRRASTSSLPSDCSSNALKINKDYLPNFTFTISKQFSTASTSENNTAALQNENTLFQFNKPAEAPDAQSDNTESDCLVILDSTDKDIDTSMADDDVVSKNAPSTQISIECSSCENENITEVLVNTRCVQKTTNLLQWTCEDCWVKNDMSISKCVCCGGKKPLNKIDNNKTSTPVETNNNPVSLPINHGSSLTNKITNDKSQEETWECHVCLLKNAKQNTKCICCDATKPGAEQSATLNSKQAEVTKGQDDKWECNVCLVRNDKHNSKCVCCEVEKPGTKKSEIKFNFSVPVNTKFKFGIDLNNTNQASNKEIVKEVETNNNVPPTQFSFGLTPINSVGESLGNNLKGSKESASNKSPQIEHMTVILEEESVENRQVSLVTESTQSLVPLNTIGQTVTKPSQEEPQPAPTALPNDGQQQNSATFTTQLQTIEIMNECSNPNPHPNNLQQKESSKVETSSRPSLPENNLFERSLNSFSPAQAPSTSMFNFGSTANQNTINIGSTNTMTFKFGNYKINSSKVKDFGILPGKFETPASQDNNNSAVDTGNGGGVIIGNGTNAFQHGDEVPNVLNSDNRLFASDQSQPRPALPTGGLFGAQKQNENSGWPPTNLFSPPLTLSTNQRNLALPSCAFNSMPFNASPACSNVTAFQRNNAQIQSPSQGFGVLPANPFAVPTPTYENQAQSTNTSGTAVGIFGQSLGASAENNILFGDTSQQMPSFNFSAGQTSTPAVFNFSQQSGIRGLTGASSPQFQVGSSSAPGQTRRIRKAVRRTTPR
ncbi:nuclear pore complex protein Nup153 isoform X3 [Pieris brassicae]|uniref:nuclear pore complex protein Nup153 isoform X3 n=1 Tax=Pieris brassicae TaxID=7116 RepID=UPI001E65E3AA|nr:nuclear pore complex protein Nup153 isoform X3 [Pieris brassicae]